MNKSGPFGYVATVAPGLLKVRRSTWIGVGVGLLVLLGILIWAVIALIGGLWGRVQEFSDATPNVVRDTARTAMEQAEVIVPGAREKIGALVPALKAEAIRRDVSGTDVGPVARYPGLVRSYWHREGREITVRYEGAADYTAVLGHYVKGFADQAYRQNLLSATPNAEQHEYIKDADRVGFVLEREPTGRVKVTIVTVLP